MRTDWRTLAGLGPLDLDRRPRIGGLYGGALGLVLAGLIPDRGRSLVLYPGTRSGNDLAGDLALFGVEPDRRLHFPDLDDDERGLERMAVLARLNSTDGGVVLASMEAATQPVPAPDALVRSAIELAPGSDAWPPDKLAARLASEEWRKVSLVTGPGEFSARGDIFDLCAPGMASPVRLEFFGDELEAVRRFDAATQRATGTLQAVRFSTRGSGESAQAMGRLLDHFGPDDMVFRVEPGEDTPPSQPGADLDGLRSGDEVWSVRQVEAIAPGAEALRERIAETCAEVKHAYFACRNDAEEQRTRHLLGDDAPDSLRFCEGRLSRSFLLPERGLAVLGYDDLLQHLTRRRPAPKRAPSRAIADFLDLEPGDFVVHLAHGIGVFRGVKRIKKDGAEVEHCAVEFKDDVRVYVPVTKIDLIQKYIGAPGGTPKLSKIGGTAWSKAKDRVKKAVTDLAVRLLEVQAMRRQRRGLASVPDDEMQHEFEATFPYEETPDQLTAMEAIKGDMQRTRPMDRLLCGDVGYGKTELAMRAAFKAVLSGRQVAVLVPTTVLAAQHFNTFRERMAGYPLRIEMLSRFRTQKEAKRILEEMREGTVDIVIGTHRLVQPNVRFKDLGMVVIDEEQRFGVEHKERFKALRATVDVLTLTATPIPRTLNMAMLGLRDISNLTTPPEGRMPVETVVNHFEKKMFKRHIERELRRGGQVFVVHNRVQSIWQIERLVAELVPAARKVVAHGQMGRKALEESMMAFVRGDADVLVATTIIESGLDIPNANTLIVDRADMIGLADLHQLRGRVGRGLHKGHALFLLPPENIRVNEVAEKRLRTIEEHSGLGAGFRIALKDLEIRGAGNILGAEQSGYIGDVGYELYCRLLEDAVKQLRNERVVVPTDTYVDLNVAALLPDEYAGEAALKLGFYRRIAAASSLADLDLLRDELADRCGALPEPAQRLFDVARLRVIGQDHAIARFGLETGGVLQMTIADADKAVPFLRARLGSALRLPEQNIAIHADPVRPPTGRAALARYLELLL
ncbi:MAG: transcription-repair coupling factor [Planctomycetota bacterium]|jgi:transcription-repair coupling factor (superfamily II helicase)